MLDPLVTGPALQGARDTIVYWRDALGWPAESIGWRKALAAKLGVSPQRITDVWQGRRKMPRDWPARAARIFQESSAKG